MMESSPLGGMIKEMTGVTKLESRMPTSAKYSLFFGLLVGIGGVACLVVAANKGPSAIRRKTPPTF